MSSRDCRCQEPFAFQDLSHGEQLHSGIFDADDVQCACLAHEPFEVVGRPRSAGYHAGAPTRLGLGCGRGGAREQGQARVVVQNQLPVGVAEGAPSFLRQSVLVGTEVIVHGYAPAGVLDRAGTAWLTSRPATLWPTACPARRAVRSCRCAGGVVAANRLSPPTGRPARSQPPPGSPFPSTAAVRRVMHSARDGVDNSGIPLL